MVSYQDREKMIWDKKQTKLSIDGCELNTFVFARDRIILKFDDIVTCPFCLEFDYLYNFHKEGGLYTCPICTNRMMSTSLIVKMDIEKFAQWVFDYRKNGFFKKVFPDFNSWCSKLHKFGLSYDFWEKYNSLKDNYSYSDE